MLKFRILGCEVTPIPPPQPVAQTSVLRLNYLGFIGAILAFLSIGLPWWTYSFSSSIMGSAASDGATVYLYQVKAAIIGYSLPVSNPWYSSTALAFLVLSGLLALTGSVITNGRRTLLALGAMLATASIMENMRARYANMRLTN